MGDEEHRYITRSQLAAQFAAQVITQRGVERGERLV